MTQTSHMAVRGPATGCDRAAPRSVQRLCRWLFAMLLWALASGMAHAALELRYGGDSKLEPFEFIDDTGRPQGFQIDLLGELARVGDFKVTVRLGDWASIEQDFRAGKLDVMAMTPTAARRQRALFTRPHAAPPMAIYYRAGTPAPLGLADLVGSTVAVPDGEAMRETRANFFAGDQYRFSTFSHPLAALEAVRDGQARFALMSRAYGDKALASGAVQGLAASAFSLRLQHYGFALAPGNEALRQSLDAALDELERAGTLDELRTKWLGGARPGAVRAAGPTAVAVAQPAATPPSPQPGPPRQRFVFIALAVLSTLAVAWLTLRMQARIRQANNERLRRREAEAASSLSDARPAHMAEAESRSAKRPHSGGGVD